MRAVGGIVVLGALLIACSDPSSTGPTGPGSDAAMQNGFDLAGVDFPATADCSDDAKRVYLITVQKELWSFDPGTSALTRIGALDCPVSDFTPEAMAVDRQAQAYVAMQDGNVFDVDTSNAHCTTSTYVPHQQDRRIYDISFSTDEGGGETLYTATAGNDVYASGGSITITDSHAGLAKFALPSFTLSIVGDYTAGLEDAQCALAGTGDGRLFGWCPYASDAGTGTALAQIDKATGATPSPIPLQVTIGAAFAFAFWGGDFWFFAAPGFDQSSTITRYRYSTDKSSSIAVADTGMTVIGAGVSTCAPTTVL